VQANGIPKAFYAVPRQPAAPARTAQCPARGLLYVLRHGKAKARSNPVLARAQASGAQRACMRGMQNGAAKSIAIQMSA